MLYILLNLWLTSFQNALKDHTPPLRAYETAQKSGEKVPHNLINFPLEHVIVFRDGVSEGEYEQVRKSEVQQIRGKQMLAIQIIPELS